MIKISILATLCFSLVSCAGLVGKGDKLYESGLYHEAADFYQRALQKNPNNVDAQLGLHRARYKIIDRGLIEVRMLRLSSNRAGATQKLEQILRHQMAWNIELQGAVTATQAEETRYAKRWLLQEAEALSQTAFPDKFRWFQYTYSHLIASTQITHQLTTYQATIETKGKKNCRSMAQHVGGQRFFLREFTEKYCASWGETTRLTTDAIDRTRFKGLTRISKIRHNTRHNNSQQDNLLAHLNTLNERFRKNIWYSPRGQKTLKVNANGSVNYTRTVTKSRRKANYNVRETVTKQTHTGQQTTQSVKVKKSHPYIVRLYQEQLTVNIRYASRLDSQLVSRNIHQVKNHTSESHNEDFPEARLKPQQPDLMNVNSLFNQQLTRLNSDFIGALNHHWKTRYCENSIGEASGEHVLRCAKISPQHTYVNNWMKQKFGINFGQMIELYGV